MKRPVSRRTVFKGTSLLVGLGATAAVAAPDASPKAVEKQSGDAVIVRSGTAVVDTTSGKVAGYIRKGLFLFKGIPYGDTTGGANRFLPPGKPKPWSGIRNSRSYGFVAPQDAGNGRQNDEDAFIFHWNDAFQGEDCLRVNVWTPGINDNRKRPVMVWLHGGGFEAGSGNDIPAFDGENLARRGDVVVVTLNHRLNVLGFLDLSKYGAKYAHSGNVGMLDIVAALEWVRDNIAGFGGDPNRVLIFGQSGGGAKVSLLMGMPAAKGLFHRAVVESGSFASNNSQEKSRKLADAFLAELGITGSTLDRLASLPYADLQRASVAAMAKANAAAADSADLTRRLADRLNFAPVPDGDVLPVAPFADGAPAMSADVPMIVGTTLNEFTTTTNHPEDEMMTDAELAKRTEALYPGGASAVVAAFRKRTPQAKPFDLWSRIATASVRRGAIRQAALKSELKKAPAYLYWFTWQTPILDGRPRAFHCAEIPFVFYNTDHCDHMTGGGPRARALSEKMAQAWIHFARTGNPNHAGMANWTPYSSETAPTMIFDDNTRILLGVDAEEQASTAG